MVAKVLLQEIDQDAGFWEVRPCAAPPRTADQLEFKVRRNEPSDAWLSSSQRALRTRKGNYAVQTGVKLLLASRLPANFRRRRGADCQGGGAALCGSHRERNATVRASWAFLYPARRSKPQPAAMDGPKGHHVRSPSSPPRYWRSHRPSFYGLGAAAHPARHTGVAGNA